MKVQTKVFAGHDLKLDGEGEGTFEAVFATLDAIDHDGDSYDPGAFGKQDVVISQYNHGSWNGGASALPVGVGKIFERDNQAIVSGEFDLEDPDGMKTYRKLKYLNSKGRNVEWSFALPDTDWRMEEQDGQHIRIYTRIAVPEVSPVLLGAGVGTELLSIKSREDEMEVKPSESIKFATQLDEAVETVEAVIGRAKEIRNLRDDEGKDLGRRSKRKLKELREAMVEAIEDVDDLLNDPNDELNTLAATFTEDTNVEAID